MSLSSALARSCCRPVTQRVQKRGMAGGFPAEMGVKKNKFIEEWNGQREITEKTFTVGLAEAPTLIMYLMLVPYGIYTWCRSEFVNGTDRRYKDVF